MSDSTKNEISSAISEAIRAKRERKSPLVEDIAQLEASLIADIEAFDLDAAERRAKREHAVNSGAGMVDSSLVFPDIVPAAPNSSKAPVKPTPAVAAENPEPIGGSLLDQLRQQVEIRQRETHSELAARTSANEAIDQALKHLFFYLHEMVQQLNILKPAIPRTYPLVDLLLLDKLSWVEGFADYRTQSQSAGALVEQATLTYRMAGPKLPTIERAGPTVDRFRTMLFDFGLPFTCKEFKNERRHVERAAFDVSCEISVSARWRADFDKGLLQLETRNLERLGSALYRVRANAVDQALLDNFGRLVLGQANHFRELANRK